MAAKGFSSRPLSLPRPQKSKREKLARQLALPASFREDGKKPVTLEQHLDPSLPTLSFDELDDIHWQALTAKRIRAQEYFEVAVPGRRVLSRAQAVREVLEGTPLGKALTEIEARQIREQAAYLQPKRGRSSTSAIQNRDRGRSK